MIKETKKSVKICHGEGQFFLDLVDSHFYKAVYFIDPESQNLELISSKRNDQGDFADHSNLKKSNNVCIVFTSEKPEFEIDIVSLINKQRKSRAYIINLPSHTFMHLENNYRASYDFETDEEVVVDANVDIGNDITNVDINVTNYGDNNISININIISAGGNINNVNQIICNSKKENNNSKKSNTIDTSGGSVEGVNQIVNDNEVDE